MDVAGVLTRLAARKLLVVLAALIAVAVALSTRYSFEHGFKLKQNSSGQAAAQLLVDTRDSALGSIVASTTDAEIDARAPLIAEYGATGQVLPTIAFRAGISAADLSVTANTSELATSGGATVSSSYNSAPDLQTVPYQVTLTATDQLPIIGVSTEAPTARQAIHLANAVAVALGSAVVGLDRPQKIPVADALDLRLLGAPEGGTVITGTSRSKTIIDGVVVFVGLLLLILVLDYLITSRRRGQPLDDTQRSDAAPPDDRPTSRTSREEVDPERRVAASPWEDDPQWEPNGEGDGDRMSGWRDDPDRVEILGQDALFDRDSDDKNHGGFVPDGTGDGFDEGHRLAADDPDVAEVDSSAGRDGGH